MKIALFGTDQLQFSKVYTPEVLKKLTEYGELSQRINKENLAENARFLADCEIAFSTWGMPQFTKEEIAEYMPNLKAVFYSAGTVQYFARPFLESGIKVFSECDIISNHLANKPELENVFNGKLFKKMKKHSTFINTGRGAQVNEYQLALSLLLHPSRTFVADVIKNERFPYVSPLFWCPNAILTPHIAGSTGNEPQRMAYYMTEEMERFLSDKPLKYEVTAESLERMA